MREREQGAAEEGSERWRGVRLCLTALDYHRAHEICNEAHHEHHRGVDKAGVRPLGLQLCPVLRDAGEGGVHCDKATAEDNEDGGGLEADVVTLKVDGHALNEGSGDLGCGGRE